MKLIFIFIFSLTVSFYSQQKKSNLTNNIDHNVYKTYKIIHYNDLPSQIKEIMKNINCGEIGADPSQENDYKTNYDSGYIVDLNDDKKPEYIFSCLAPSHGAGQGKIYSIFEENWEIIGEIDVFENPNPEINIKILKSKNQGFHDLASSSVYSSRDVIVRYINKMYYNIHTSSEVIKNLPFYIEHYSQGDLNKCHMGISNTPEKTVMQILQQHFDDYEKFYYAVDSNEDAQKVKNALNKKGLKFLNEYNNGQIIFCYIKVK